MEAETIADVLVDRNHDSYKKFFDHDWCRRMFEAVENSPMKKPVADLMIALRSANGAYVLPWLEVESLRSYADGEILGSLKHRATYAEEVIKRVLEKIEAAMHFSLDHDQRSNLKRFVANAEKEAYDAIRTARSQVKMDVAAYWDFLTSTSEFQFSLFGTQYITYGYLFFAYEDFLSKIIRIKEPNYSTKKKPINEAFEKHWGAPLTEFCWNHDEVQLAKLVRNALVHNGGDFGPDLEKRYKTRFVDVSGQRAPLIECARFLVVKGKIQITPDNTRYLFGVVKERLTKIVFEGTIELDQKPCLAPGQVTDVLRQTSDVEAPMEDWWQFMQRTRRELEASGSRFMNEDEVQAHLEELRESDRIDEMLHEQQRNSTGCS